MANGQYVTIHDPRLRQAVTSFWTAVGKRLVTVHRVKPVIANKAMGTYRRKVGNVALNAGYVETAKDIASKVKTGSRPVQKVVVAPKYAKLKAR